MFQHFNPYSSHNHTVPNPGCPWEGEIPNGLHPGKQIHVTGHVPHHAQRAQFDLKTYNGTAMHLNPRFDQSALVLNSESNGGWANEERHGNPFQRGMNFDLVITVEHDKYRIQVNGRHACDFRHRSSFQEVRRFGIVGDVQVHQITFTESGGSGGHNHGSLNVPGAVPLRQNCHPGRMIQINGTPNPNANRFVINLQSSAGNDPPNIPLHMSVRWNDPVSQGPVVVRTNCQNGSWGSEERDGYCPFQKGMPFQVLILVEAYELKIAVNGQHFASFRHRSPLDSINHVGVNGDVSIQNVNIY